MGHNIIFNGVNSADYGILISGAGTYATPERNIQSIPVPGRNGDIQIDNGRYNNIQVRFEAGLSRNFEPNYLPFLRELLSAPLYSRLEDSYHPDEFRLATFRSEMVPDVGTIMRSGKFELIFDAMPQWFLKSGEIEIAYPDSSKTKQTIYKYTDFTAESKTNLLDPVEAIKGYDMVNMEYYVLDMTGHTGVTDDAIVIEGDFEEFFAVLCADNPLTETSNTSSIIYTQSFVRPSFTPTYWILPIGANIKIYIEGVLEYESPTEHKTIQNPTLFASKPTVKLTVPADATEPVGYLFAINENGVLMRRSSEYLYNTAQTITIDCETMDAYSLPEDNPQKTRVNWNPCISFLKAPEIRPGNNDLAYDGTVSDVKVIPKWWTI